MLKTLNKKHYALYGVLAIVALAASYFIFRGLDLGNETGGSSLLSFGGEEEYQIPPHLAFPTLKPFTGPDPTIAPQPRHVSQPQYTEEELDAMMKRFEGQFALEKDVLKNIAKCVSDYNPNLFDDSRIGLFQFQEPTWIELREKLGEETDPNLRFFAEEATQTAGYVLANDLDPDGIWGDCAP